MNPPRVYELTIPSSQRTSRITAMVQSMSDSSSGDTVKFQNAIEGRRERRSGLSGEILIPAVSSLYFHTELRARSGSERIRIPARYHCVPHSESGLQQNAIPACA